MLMPKKVRHRKTHRGRMTGAAKGGTKITFGDFGIQALEPGWITNRQIEAARIAMTRYIKRGGKVWINIFPDKPVTQKPAETRMGSGKGNPEHWVAVVKPGRVMFELSGVPEPPPARRCGSRSTSSRSRRASSCARKRRRSDDKANELARAQRRRAADQLRSVQGRAVQPAFPERDRSARQQHPASRRSAGRSLGCETLFGLARSKRPKR